MQPRRKILASVVAFLLIAGMGVPVLALSHPLSSTAIRDAYFLGSRRDLKTQEFLSQYRHPLPAPKTGPYVDEIGIDTPFTQVVERSARALDYYAPDAVEEFQTKPMNVCVHVDIALTPTYSPIPEPPAPALYQWVPDFWNDFVVRLIQGNETVLAAHRRGGPVYFYGRGGTPLVWGARIELDYDPAELKADSATIEVLTPDGQKVETTFDLGKLR